MTRSEGSGLLDSVASLLIAAEVARRQEVAFMVNYEKSFDQMIAHSGCGINVDSDIVEVNFPVSGCGEVLQQAFLVPLEVRMTNDAVSTRLNMLGLEDASLAHLCALADTHADLGKQPIAARASFLMRSVGKGWAHRPHYSSLCNWNGRGRELALVNVAGVWSEQWRILAVPKVIKAA